MFPESETCASAATSLCAGDVARGVCRFLYQAGVTAICEVPLGNGRRADVLGLDSRGEMVIVEIKVSLADLRGDEKWPEYLDYCDRFYWAVPCGFALPELELPAYMPGRSGLLVADRYGAALQRDALRTPLAPARRRSETLRFARRAAERLLRSDDPFFAEAS
jgi:hypothetical protein